jgi:chromosome segregation ATPase
MVEATEIEKKSLEAHVELCAERYNALDNRLLNVDNRIFILSETVDKVHELLEKMSEKRNDQLIGWATTVMGVLVSTIAYLILHYVIK